MLFLAETDTVVQISGTSLVTGLVSGGATIGGAIVAAAKMLGWAFEKKERERMEETAKREREHLAELRDMANANGQVARQFVQIIREQREDRRETTTSLIQLNKEVVTVVGEVKGAVATMHEQLKAVAAHQEELATARTADLAAHAETQHDVRNLAAAAGLSKLLEDRKKAVGGSNNEPLTP